MSRGAHMMNRVLGISAITLLIGGAEGLVAQRQGTLPSGAGRRNDMEVRVQARFDNLVREELELGDDQWRQLQAAVEDFRARRLDFSRGERNTRARVGRLGGGGPGGGPGGGRELTEQEALEILAARLELSDSEATLVREEQEALLRILSAQQLVRYFVMRQQQGDMVLRIRGRGGPGRGRQGGGGRGRGGRGGAGGR